MSRNSLSFFLLQTLADKIAVSCSLVRGEYNRAWNEVLLPEDDYTVIVQSVFIWLTKIDILYVLSKQLIDDLVIYKTAD